jgi:hypothetical protein
MHRIGRFGFLPSALVTAAVIFKAQNTEYRGLEFMKLAGGLVALSAVGTVIFTILAFRLRKHGGNLEMFCWAAWLARCPSWWIGCSRSTGHQGTSMALQFWDT